MIYNVSKLSFRYPESDRQVLDEASLSLGKGEILCILGPNGAGKTTLLKCMAGLLPADSGTIEVCGKDIKKLSPKKIASMIGYVPQNHTPAFDYRVLDFVLMGIAPKTGIFGRPSKEDEAFCMDVLESMNIAHLAHKSYINISGGERQQVMIARAIAQEPEAVLFDEPTAHLDYGNQHRVLKRIKKMAEDGYSVAITTHNPEHALLLDDKVAIVGRDGKIIQGHSRDIITEEVLRKVYDIDVELIYMENPGRNVCFVPNL